jgi:hypothetical protein
MIARWMIVGFVLWIAVAVAFRFVGQDVLQAGSNLSWLFLTLPIGMLIVTYALLKIMRVAPTDRAEAASIMAVPGLLAGIYQINSYEAVFPNLDPALGGAFASLMFACYAAVIVAGIVASRLQSI